MRREAGVREGDDLADLGRDVGRLEREVLDRDRDGAGVLVSLRSAGGRATAAAADAAAAGPLPTARRGRRSLD